MHVGVKKRLYVTANLAGLVEDPTGALTAMIATVIVCLIKKLCLGGDCQMNVFYGIFRW